MSKTNPTAPAAEPDAESGIEHTNTAPHGVETSLGGITREQVQADSPIYREILDAVAFHAGSGSTAQLVRDVLGTIARAATPGGIVKRPVNRPAELREFPAAALRQLAALCRVWAPGDDIPATPAADVERPAPEHASAPLPTESPDTLTVEQSPAPPVPGQAEAVDAIETALRVERVELARDVIPIPLVFHSPEPYRPELDVAYEIPPAELVAPALVFHAPEPWRDNAPPSPTSPAGDDIPF